MPFLSGKRAFLELLKQEGVRYLFGNPGTTELPLMDGLAEEPALTYVLGLQEAAVVAMADGYAQASNTLGVVNVHVAPGLGNALGMLYDAQKAGAPLLVTAGQHDQTFTATEPILWADLPPIARPFVKWSAEVRRLDDLPRLVHRAAKTALAPPSGPVFLSLPADVLQAEGPVELGAPTRVAPRIRGDLEAVEVAASVLARAERPLILAGDAVARGDAHAELVRVAEALGAPVYTEGVASSASFPASHPLFRGSFVRVGPAVRHVLSQADVLFSVGGDLVTLSLPSDVDPVPPDLEIVHLDIDPWELGKNYPTRVAILGDPKSTLPDLLAALERRLTPAWRARARERLEATRAAKLAHVEELRARAQAEAARSPITPLAAIAAVADALPPEAVVVDESISSGVGLRTLLRSDDPRSFFGLRGGGIGWGLPAAIGVKLALPDRPVVGLIGDGSAMYTCQALWTAARYRVPVVLIILNNASYRILKQRIHAMKGVAAQTDRYIAMDLDDPRVDFVGLAGALGIEGERIDRAAGLGPAVQRATAAGRPVLLDVQLDPAFKAP
ncbi:MAG TPA: thiamine pyrophosphate-binding protein [Methylomirabilota bacterium]|nr:thiamine pyrophosphate-binding protein [Methylomirabilota bacterium]